MSIIAYILLAFSLGISQFVIMRECSSNTRVRLSWGLILAIVMVVMEILMVGVGEIVGNLLRFDIEEVDNLIFLGILVFVAVRMMLNVFSKHPHEYSYDISKFSTVFLLAIAININALIIGFGIGFKALVETDIWKMSIPMLLISYPFVMWAIMLGRQQVQIRPRRWSLFSILFLLVFTLLGTFFS